MVQKISIAYHEYLPLRNRIYLSLILTPSDSSHQALSIDVVFVSIRPHLHRFFWIETKSTPIDRAQ